MRDTIFDAIIGKLQAMPMLQGGDGTLRVYDYPETQPSGYPYAVVGSGSLSSEVEDNVRDAVRYSYTIQIVGEKFGGDSAFTQSQALKTMRVIEDALMAVIRGDNDLSVAGVIRTMPVQSDMGTTDGGSRIVLTVTLVVDTFELITI